MCSCHCAAAEVRHSKRFYLYIAIIGGSVDLCFLPADADNDISLTAAK